MTSFDTLKLALADFPNCPIHSTNDLDRVVVIYRMDESLIARATEPRLEATLVRRADSWFVIHGDEVCDRPVTNLHNLRNHMAEANAD